MRLMMISSGGGSVVRLKDALAFFAVALKYMRV
jgi:hypothetical protein